MHLAELEKGLSEKRLSTYYTLFPADKEKAIEYYRINMQIAESFYPLLSNLEIVLRNSIHRSFSIHFSSADWPSLIKQNELADQVNIAKRKILTSRHSLTPDKLIAELTLGFWTALFNKQYAREFWKPLMYAFPMFETKDKQRDKISFTLNQVRKFRNRIFHYEPVCNDLAALEKNHTNIMGIIKGINVEVLDWTKQIDRFDSLYKKAVRLRTG